MRPNPPRDAHALGADGGLRLRQRHGRSTATRRNRESGAISPLRAWRLEIRSLLRCRSLKREYWRMWHDHESHNSEPLHGKQKIGSARLRCPRAAAWGEEV